MLSLQLKLILISLLATVSAITLDPCNSEAAAKPGGLIKMIVHNYDFYVFGNAKKTS